MINILSFTSTLVVCVLYGYVLTKNAKKSTGLEFYPLFGFGFITIISNLFYRLGVSINVLSYIIWITAAAIIFAVIVRISKKNMWLVILLLGKPYWKLLFVLFFLVIMFIPPLVGGINFAIYQGNFDDALGYTGSATAFAHNSFSSIVNNPPTSTGAFFSRPDLIIKTRPGVAIVQSMLFRAPKMSIINGSYGYVLALLVIIAVTIYGLIRKGTKTENHSKTSAQIFILVGCFIVGYWGQYLLDQNSWSTLAAIPFLTCIPFFLATRNERTRFEYWIQAILLYLPPLILYPEATLFVSPAYLIFLIRLSNKQKIENIILFLVCLVFTWVINPFSLTFIQGQFNVANSDITKGWEKHFDSFYLGNPGERSEMNLWDFPRTFIGALFGMSHATPSSTNSLNLFNGFLVSINFLFIIAIVFYAFRAFKNRNFSLIITLIIIYFLQSSIILFRGNIWAAGKSVTYYISFVFIILVSWILISSKSNLKGNSLAMKFLVFFWVASQLGFAFLRIGHVSEIKGLDFPSNYLIARNEQNAIVQDFRIPDVKELKSCPNLEMNISDEKIAYYVSLRLLELEIPYEKSSDSKNDIQSETQKGNNGSKVQKCTISNLNKLGRMRIQLTL